MDRSGYLVVRRRAAPAASAAPYLFGGSTSGGSEASQPPGWTPAQEQRYQQQLQQLRQHIRFVVELRDQLAASRVHDEQQWGVASAAATTAAAVPGEGQQGPSGLHTLPLAQQQPQEAEGQLLPQASCPPAPQPPVSEPLDLPAQLSGELFRGFLPSVFVDGRRLAMTWNPPAPS